MAVESRFNWLGNAASSRQHAKTTQTHVPTRRQNEPPLPLKVNGNRLPSIESIANRLPLSPSIDHGGHQRRQKWPPIPPWPGRWIFDAWSNSIVNSFIFILNLEIFNEIMWEKNHFFCCYPHRRNATVLSRGQDGEVWGGWGVGREAVPSGLGLSHTSSSWLYAN